MHAPDGYVNAATAAGAAVVAAGGVGAALRQSSAALSERRLPFAGLVAALIFALQMLNFPVAAGTSGHLLGGALAAILLGPWMGMVVVTVVVVVQAVLFADGGITALGINVLNMAVITTLVAWPVLRGLVRLLPQTTGSAVGASLVAAWASVVASSVLFTLQYALGGQGGADLGTVFGAMVGVHALIGIGEGLITGAALGAVLAVRPDLVAGAEGKVLRRTVDAPPRMATGAFIISGLVVAAALVIFVAPLASGDPDGLERVAEDTGFIASAEDHPVGGPLADYGVEGVESEAAGTIVAGLIGVGLTFAVGLGVLALIRRNRQPTAGG